MTVLYDLPFEEYRAIPALNQSTLKLMGVGEKYGATPKHAKAVYDGKLKHPETDTLRLGRAEHCWIFEGPEIFHDTYLVAPDKCQATTKDGKACNNTPKSLDGDQWFCGVHQPKSAEYPRDYITASHRDRIKAMCESLRSHEIGQHFKRTGWSELTITRTVEVGGAQLDWKDRIDRLAKPTRTLPFLVIDLKRMPLYGGARALRESVIARYGWDIQAAGYTEGVRQEFDTDRCDFLWVFVEEKYPHDVAWIPAGQHTLTVGADKLERYREEWVKCSDSNDWPGYAVGNQPAGGLAEHYIQRYYERMADVAE